MSTSSLDPHRLERILAPWTADPGGPAVTIEDADGTTIAGRTADPDGEGPPIGADIVVGGTRVARVVATGGARETRPLATALESLAMAIAELVTETLSRESAERALHDRRAGAAAVTIGADVRQLAKGRLQQRSIVSMVAPDVPGYDLASHYAAAGEIGGDLFELFRLRRRGHPLGIVIADVTGKGLDAALLMAFARPVIHSALEGASGPAEALERTNRVLVEERRGTLFITALCAVLEPRSGRIRIADAGHEPPWHIPGDGGPISEIGAPGVLVGAFATLDAPEVVTTLEPGDVLLFYTDGVTDAVDPSGQRFGDARLLATLGEAQGGSAHDLVEAVSHAVLTFQAHAAPADDVTIVAVGRHRRRRAPRDAAVARPDRITKVTS